MAKELHMDELKRLLSAAKEKIAAQRQAIFAAHQLAPDFAREEYAFAYMQAERLGMRAIREQLDMLGWLPTQLDPDGEVKGEMRAQMRAWIKGEKRFDDAPSSDDFGNDFIHALTRCALATKQNKARCGTLAKKIGRLFYDLALLVSCMHCSNVLRDFNIEYVEFENPKDLALLAQELAMVMDYLIAEAETEMEKAKAPTGRKQKTAHLRLVKSDHSGPTGLFDLDIELDPLPAH